MKSHSHAGSLVSKGFQRNRSHQCTKKEQNIYIGPVRYCIWIPFLYHFECKISKEPVLPLNIHPFIQVNCWGCWLWLLPQQIPNWCPFAPWQHLSAWPRRKETPPWEKRKSKDSPNKCENNMPPKIEELSYKSWTWENSADDQLWRSETLQDLCKLWQDSTWL